MRQQADDGTWRNWAEAHTYCDDLVIDGHDDWRLPRIDELEPIINFSTSDPASYNPPFTTLSHWGLLTFGIHTAASAIWSSAGAGAPEALQQSRRWV